MSVQVLHEAEHTRQHARYNIPARIAINSKIYELANWSVGGLAIKGISDVDALDDTFEARLAFDFETILTAMDVKLVKKNYNKDTNILSCGFEKLDNNKLSLIHYIINAYLSGDVAIAGSFIEVLKHDRFTKKDLSKKLERKLSKTEKILYRIRQLAIYAFLTLVTIGLITFILYSIYNKLFVIKSVSAVVDAPVVVVRSPAPSYYIPTHYKIGSKVTKGKLLASMKLIGGGASSIESPVNGVILSKQVIDNSFVDRAEPILTIIPDGVKPHISAKVLSSQASKITIGDEAEVKLPNGEIIMAKVKSIKSAESIINLKANPLQKRSSSPYDYVRVIIEPYSKLSIVNIDKVATVTIDTF
jgi:alginate biosynthesis protein Alg44